MPKRAGMGADLVDELAAEGIVLLQHLGPQIRVHVLQDVARACTLNSECLFVQATSASSQEPRL